MNISQDVEKAHKTALLYRGRSHSPYSKFAVGAALKLKGVDTPVGGCNVENASFGGTICAERVAFLTAVAEYGSLKPEFLLVVTEEAKATVPCALCLQTLAEFCADDFVIYLANHEKVLRQVKLSDLLPEPFRNFTVSRK